MPGIAILFGILLIGVTAATLLYNGGFTSPTVFIPAVIGLLIAGMGTLAKNARMRMHAMHGAVLIGLLGGIACLGMGIRQLTKLSGENAPTAVQLASVWSTAILCLLFVVLCIQSFIRARRDRLAK